MENSGTAQSLPLDRLEPADAEDRLRRALFYCHCLHLYSKRSIELLIGRVEAGELSEELQELVPQLTDWKLESAYKLLTCVNLHIAGLDNSSEETPPWVLEFFSDAAQETDELFPTPPALDILARHGSWKRERMLRGVSEHVSEILQFTDETKMFNQQIEQFLADSATYRTELLLFALSQPLETLRHHLEMFE